MRVDAAELTLLPDWLYMNTKLGRRRREQILGDSDLWLIPFERSKVNSLSPETRYTFALLASIFHELNALHKLIQVCSPDPKGPNYEGSAGISQTTMLVRVLVGKVHEAREALTRSEVGKVLKREFFPLVTDAANRWRAIGKGTREKRWIKDMRNEHAFHYPTFDRVGTLLKDQWPADGGMVLGRSPGNTFYITPEQAMMLAMCSASGLDGNVFKAFGIMLEDAYKLSNELKLFVNDLLRFFVDTRLAALGDPKPMGHVRAPEIDSIKVPYFFVTEERTTTGA